MPATLYTPTDGGWDLFDNTPLAGALQWGKALLYDADKVSIANGEFDIFASYGLDLGIAKEVKTIISYDNRASTTWFTADTDSVGVYKSDDDNTWTLVEQFDGPPRGAGKFTLELTAAQTARYFKIRNMETMDWLMVAGAAILWITELEFWSPSWPWRISGTVKLQGVAAERLVRVHNRATGALVDSITSNPDGSFELEVPDTTTDHYVVAFDDDAGEQYNALIYDRVKGVLPP